MYECPVCLQLFDQGDHIPKSLACRHAVCKRCLLSPHGPPLPKCPICRRGIIDRFDLPNDLSIIQYLEKKERKRYIKERKEKIKGLIEEVVNASEDVGERLKKKVISATQTLEEKSAKYTLYVKHLFETCQQRCGSKRFLSNAAIENHKKLEAMRQELQASVAACTSLFDNPHVTADDIEKRETEARNALREARDSGKPGVSERATWHDYRILLIKTFTDISKEPPPNDISSVAGN